ncbi:MAG: hypothetical protein HQL31_03555 [Planctomycetes bacterium]|nr:hypothetical protein [Planctomycetota bacterium]
MRPLCAIAFHTLTEILRQPFYGLLLLMAMFATAMSPFLALFSFMEGDRMVVDVGLSTLLLLGLLLAAVSSASILRSETDQHIAAVILVKPVGRTGFIAAKFAGILASLMIAFTLVVIIMLLAKRMGVPETASWKLDQPAFLAEVLPLILAVVFALLANYFTGAHFASTAAYAALLLYVPIFFFASAFSPEWEASPLLAHIEFPLLRAVLMVFMAVCLLASVSMVIASRLRVAATVVSCVAVLFVGMGSDYIFGRYAEDSWAAWLGYTLFPCLQTFWMADLLSRNSPIPAGYLGGALAYASAYTLAMLAFASFLFEGREI